jgi:uncharacterized Zn finger protein (UPF0148 family)
VSERPASPAVLPIVRRGYGKGFPMVRGECPACGVRALFLAAGGYVTCGGPTCGNPSAASDALDPYWQEEALARRATEPQDERRP